MLIIDQYIYPISHELDTKYIFWNLSEYIPFVADILFINIFSFEINLKLIYILGVENRLFVSNNDPWWKFL